MTEAERDHQKRFQQAVESLTGADEFLVVAITERGTDLIHTGVYTLPYLIDVASERYNILMRESPYSDPEGANDGHPYDDDE